MMAALHLWAALLLLTSQGLAPVRGCSSVTYPVGDGTTTSARTLDALAVPQLEVTKVPSGTNIPLMRVAGGTNGSFSSLGENFTSSYDFACITAGRQQATALFSGALRIALQPRRWPGPCIDGINSQGLSAAMMWQPATAKAGVPEYGGGGPALEQADVVTYLLGRFASVDDIKAQLDGGLKVIYNPNLPYATGVWKLTTAFMPVHWHVTDKAGASLVLEFTASEPYAQNAVVDRAVGVLASEPLWAAQLQGYNSRLQTQTPITTSKGTTLLQVPGSWSSADRFMRLAMLRTTAAANAWPLTSNYSAAAPGTGLSPRNAAVLSAMAMIQTAALPQGVDAFGGASGSPTKECTVVTVVRDHATPAYFFRTASTPTYRAINLTHVNWDSMRATSSRIKYLQLRSFAWSRDVSSF